MFPLVPAYPCCPGQMAVKWLLLYFSGTGIARGCGPHRAALAMGGKWAKIVFKNSRENSDCIISCAFACNKNKALQLQ